MTEQANPIQASVQGRSPRLNAALQALFVTFLWSMSFVLIKIGLEDIPALTFAGLRYMLAFLCLLVVLLRSPQRQAVRGLSRRQWAWLVALGLVYYTITQGTQFLGLSYLNPATVSLVLSFSPAVIAVMGLLFLHEAPGRQSWFGMALSMVGVVIYFYPADLPAEQTLGLVIVTVGLLTNGGASVMGRHINRSRTLSPLLVTTVSMGIGATVLLLAGLFTQGLPQLSAGSWAIIVWLAVVHTAFTFTLWNHTLRTLSAIESGIINNTMLIQIGLLTWLFLQQSLTIQEILGMAVVLGGTLLVQLRRKSPAA